MIDELELPEARWLDGAFARRPPAALRGEPIAPAETSLSERSPTLDTLRSALRHGRHVPRSETPCLEWLDGRAFQTSARTPQPRDVSARWLPVFRRQRTTPARGTARFPDATGCRETEWILFLFPVEPQRFCGDPNTVCLPTHTSATI